MQPAVTSVILACPEGVLGGQSAWSSSTALHLTHPLSLSETPALGRWALSSDCRGGCGDEVKTCTSGGLSLYRTLWLMQDLMSYLNSWHLMNHKIQILAREYQQTALNNFALPADTVSFFILIIFDDRKKISKRHLPSLNSLQSVAPECLIIYGSSTDHISETPLAL
jgi:UDP-N-acetylmuramyl pentapeptide phosphotransferase/UDP-N-acetylglucosamine-1-phosphate transferase